jgi:hypothetical protein
MMERPTRGVAPRSAFLFAVALLLAGCRTYGGYDSEDKLHAHIERANQLFADELTRRRADLDFLTRLSTENPVLGPFTEQFRAAVLVHDAALGEAQGLAAALEDEDDHRPLKRAYGGIIAQQEAIRRQYRGVLQQLAQPPDTALVHVRYYAPESRYMIVPPYYERVHSAGDDLSLASAVRGASFPAGGTPEQDPPDTTAAPAGSATVPADTAGVGGHGQ